MSVILEAQNLYKVYHSPEEQVVLQGVNLQLNAGDCVSLQGNSGSGKSTLLNCLGLIDSLDSGVIKFQGHELQNAKEKERARFRLENIGFVFQFHHLIPELSATENVLLPATLRGKIPLKRAEDLLAWVGLGDKRKRFPWQLSGGEQQRVAICRALINEPNILLTDEATGNLDPQRSSEVIDLLLKLNHESGLTLLSVTHDSELALRYQKKYSLRNGALEELS